MKGKFTLMSDKYEDVTLRTITELDCDNLRQWKNANRFAFFYQEIIAPEAQKEWFEGYLKRDNDYMFIVLHYGEPVGCLGIRLLNGYWDIYNVILGRPEMGGKGLMSKALQLICSYIHTSFNGEIRLKVLRSNRALAWYRKNGFSEVAAHDTFFELKLDSSRFQPQQSSRL